MAEFDLNGMMDTYKDLARGYLFYCRIATSPVSWNRDYVYLVRSTALPARTIEEMPVNWQGNIYKLASTSTYATFTITFSVDVDSKVRKALLDWSNLIHDPRTNAHGDPTTYMGTVELTHISGQNAEIAKYNLIKAWPSEVGEVALDYGTKDVANFSTTWTYQYFEEV